MKIDEFKSRIARIKKLLDEPEPGLFTWHEILGIEMTQLIERWQEKLVPENEEPDANEIVRRLNKWADADPEEREWMIEREIIDDRVEFVITRLDQHAERLFPGETLAEAYRELAYYEELMNDN